MFSAVTITAECGSGGSAIAHRVAEILGWNLWDHTLVEAVAAAAQVDTEVIVRYDERVDSWWHRFNRAGLTAAAIQAGVSNEDAKLFDAETVAGLTQRTIAGAAAGGDCVIVGRGAQCVLQDRPDVYHVFVYAPWGERVARVRSQAGSTGDIGEFIRQRDEQRAAYVRTYYGCDWKDPHLYHMMIGSEVALENAACLIVEAVLRGSRYAADLSAIARQPTRLSHGT